MKLDEIIPHLAMFLLILLKPHPIFLLFCLVIAIVSMMEWRETINCPCGGGQNCIVHRRMLGDWVHEDDMFAKVKLPLRTNCFQEFTEEQRKALNEHTKAQWKATRQTWVS
jgi:hypothetical protein